jgi:hypothetical protein
MVVAFVDLWTQILKILTICVVASVPANSEALQKVALGQISIKFIRSGAEMCHKDTLIMTVFRGTKLWAQTGCGGSWVFFPKPTQIITVFRGTKLCA